MIPEVAYDIETMRNEALIPLLPEPKIKLGNLTDPSKIAVKKQEAKEDQIQAMTLNPLYCRICSCAFVNDQYAECRVIEDNSDAVEIDLLEWAFAIIGEHRVIGYNSKKFDIRMLYCRAIILGIDVRQYGAPVLEKMTSRYNNERHIDLMEQWCAYGEYEKLDHIFRFACNGESKLEIDFNEFPELIKSPEGREKIRAYNLQDTEPLWRFWQRCKGILIQ